MQRLLKAAQAKNLDRIAVAYAVAGWVLVQGASIVLPAFDTPAWTLKAFIVAVIVGFPAALAIAWLAAPKAPLDASSEATPGGLSHREIVMGSLLAVVLLLSVGELIFMVRRGPLAPGASIIAPAEASIAVLPFRNMSGNPAREVVSDGISEELLDELSNVAALRVAARTSSFAFKGKNEDIKEIARVLSVHSVLEGSIREDGDHIRIAAQLINAVDGFPIWSATYDRQMTGILTLEDDIARAITIALTHKLLRTPQTTLAGRPASIDPEIYRKYLEGMHDFGPRDDAGILKAVVLFREVTAAQPDFAQGFAVLGRALIDQSEYHPAQKELLPQAEAALARALVLDPNNIEALGAQLDLALHRQDWRTADANAKRMKMLSPNSTAVLHEMFRYYQLLGFPDQAVGAAAGAALLDPLSIVDRLNLTTALLHVARFGEAVTAAQAALALKADQNLIKGMICTAYAHSGQLEKAHAMAAELSKARDKSDSDACAFDMAVGEGRLADAHRMNDAYAAQYPKGDLAAVDLADNYGIIGDAKATVRWMERAYDQKEFTIFAMPFDHSIRPSVFNDPGWKALMQRPLFKDWRAAHDKLAAELGVAN